jgi:positive regulator of sigma E activity
VSAPGPRPTVSSDSPGPLTGSGEESTAAGIYGVIVSAAVMAASHAQTATAVAIAVLFTLVVYWAAERYSRLVAERIHDGRRPSWTQVRRQLTLGWAMVTASALPLVVLIVVALLGARLYVAVLSALVCSTVLLCVAGWEMGRHGQLTTRERLVSTAVAGFFGVSMVVLKALLH